MKTSGPILSPVSTWLLRSTTWACSTISILSSTYNRGRSTTSLSRGDLRRKRRRCEDNSRTEAELWATQPILKVNCQLLIVLEISLIFEFEYLIFNISARISVLEDDFNWNRKTLSAHRCAAIQFILKIWQIRLKRTPVYQNSIYSTLHCTPRLFVLNRYKFWSRFETFIILTLLALLYHLNRLFKN